jgi:hypothetical protein
MAGPVPVDDDQAASFAPASTAIGAGDPSVGSPTAPTTVSVHFKMIFLAVFSLTVALLAARVGVAIMVVSPSDSLKDAMSTCNMLSNAGFGAMLGLIGGKIS